MNQPINLPTTTSIIASTTSTVVLNFENEIKDLIKFFTSLEQKFKQSEYYCDEKYIVYCEITMCCDDPTKNKKNVKYLFKYKDCNYILDDLNSINHHKTYEDDEFKKIVKMNSAIYTQSRHFLVDYFCNDFKTYTCSEIHECKIFSTGKSASIVIKYKLMDHMSVIKIVESTGEIFYVANKNFNELAESVELADSVESDKLWKLFQVEKSSCHEIKDIEDFDFDNFEKLFDEGDIIYIETICFKNQISCCYQNDDKISFDLLTKIINGTSLFESIEYELQHNSENYHKYLIVHTINHIEYIINSTNLSSNRKNIDLLADLFDNGKISHIKCIQHNKSTDKLTAFCCSINDFEINFEKIFKHNDSICLTCSTSSTNSTNTIELSVYPDDVNVDIIFDEISNQFDQFNNLTNFIFYTSQGHVQEIKLKSFLILSSDLKQMFMNGNIICIENSNAILYGAKIKFTKRKQMHNSFYNRKKQRKFH